MRLRSLFSLAIALGFPLLCSGAHAAVQQCGASAHDAIAAAEKALATKDDASRDTALACLLQAVKDLDAHRADTVSNDGNRFVHVPAGSHWTKPK